MSIRKPFLKLLREGKVIRLDHLNPQIITKCKFILNPTRIQLDNLLNEDKYRICRAFIAEDDDLYAWRGYTLTHYEAKDTLYQKGGYDIKPILALVMNENTIQVANTWNNKEISEQTKDRVLHNSHLEILFGKDYQIYNL